MKLERVRIDQFQQFRSPLEITDLAPGLNLFTGPNESGKSTLVRAIRAAFFERHRTTSVAHLQPWGDSSAGPEVLLEFDWQGSRWTLNKRFLKSRRCDLQGGGETYSGDEADDRLAELLGYEFPGRGASKAEHWGIPGLLWVEQGALQDTRDPVGYAGEHLQSALSQSLGDALGEVASSGGDALIARVEHERGKLLTATGRPTGDYRQAGESCTSLAAERRALETQITDYRGRVDRLGELERERRDIDAARPWEEQQASAEASRQALKAVEEQQRLQQEEGQQLQSCERNAGLWRQQLQDMEDQKQQLEKRGQDKTRLEQQLEQLRAGSSGIQQHVAEAEAVHDRAEEALTAARRHAHCKTLQAEQERVSEQHTRLSAALKDARRLRDGLQRLTEQHQAVSINDGDLKQLRELENELEKLGIRQQTLATRLAYRLESGQQLMLDERPLIGSGEEELVSSAELHIPGVGSLTVTPGGQDVKELARRQESLTAERDVLRQQLGVANLADAEDRAKRADELERNMQAERAELKGLAPGGLDALEDDQRLTEQRHRQLVDELEQLPEVPAADTLQDEAQAKAALASAHDQLRAAEQAAQTHRSELGLAQQALATATNEWQSLHDALDDPARRERRQQARDALTDLQTESKRLTDSIKQRRQEIDAANPDALSQDIERHMRAADSLYQQAQKRESEIRELQIRLEELGARGLEEQYDAVCQEHERLERRHAELKQQAEALDLLLDLLREQRQTVTRRLQAPLQKHLRRYLRLLFPGAELTVDEDLKPETLIREGVSGEEHSDLEALSFGAREQMGLITRLAYADLLEEAGRPTLIILDDALVHCDQARREQMTRILFDAARRHQILLFTCHPENWQALGAMPRDLPSLKMTAV